MTREEAQDRAAQLREKNGASWPVAQDIGDTWSLAWSAVDLTQGEARRRRSLGLTDYPPTSFPANFLEIREGDS